MYSNVNKSSVMMKDYIFGMEAVVTGEEAGTSDFKVYTADDGGNHNPYNKDYFDALATLSISNNAGRITSIPSPYARMHVTDLAFRESVCGIHKETAAAHAKRSLSKDYLRAMSHCLDIFELLFHADEFDLGEKGITLHKVDLISTHSIDPEIQKLLKDENGMFNSLGSYVQTLDLFRDEYKKVLRDKGVERYKFDFSSLYLFKYRGKTFASTSPFTGFCVKPDCNLDGADLILTGQTRKLLSADAKTWKKFDDRDLEFRKFMYLLLKDSDLCEIFENLFAALKYSLSDNVLADLDRKTFNDVQQYRKFNVTDNLLQMVQGRDVFIRPDGLDCSYLKYLLYLEDPVDLSIHREEYEEKDINRRKFPKDGEFLRWIGVNDLLADSLFVLTYDINNNYKTVPYLDKVKENRAIRRCLLPIKRLALDFFDMDYLIQNLSIVKREQNVFVVTLKLDVEDGGHVILRREYRTDECDFPNGRIVHPNDMKSFAFGIYPFVKSTVNKNIYKVLFYNSFANGYGIRFYKRNNEGIIQPLLENERQSNRTNDININAGELPINCEYHHLEITDGLEFAEVEIENVGTSLIVPNLRTVYDIPGTVNVGIDLGTSNTYVAYSYQANGMEDEDVNIQEICTHHNQGGEWNELTFMNKKCTREDDSNAPEKNREDLYLRMSDLPGVKPSDECLDSQLCEFIPSRIDPNLGNESYCFPIPSVVNFLRINGIREDYRRSGINEPCPLLHSAIPFAYYERGLRQGTVSDYYDVVRAGSQFKWFYKKDNNGDYVQNDVHAAYFKAFVAELLFIVRSHLVCKGYDLTQTKILWSYPLSFSRELVDEYVNTWNEQYRKIINPDVDDSNIDQFVMYTNESRSPIFDCLNTDAVDHLVLLLDIGGGSTDIIGYRQQQPAFISSFGFAGNSLYLDGSLNTMEPGAMRRTILKYFVDQQSIFSNPSNNGNGKAQKISKDAPISTLMNYGFTKAPGDFKRIFNNPGPKFMLLMHNAALIYHVAQLCKIKSPDEPPIGVYLTGNGSKLFELNSDYEQMIRDIFKYVYEGINMDEMLVDKPSNPKATTVKGALKGYQRRLLETNQNSNRNCFVLLGDEKSVYDLNPIDGGANVECDGDYKNAVRTNVEKFIEMFYSVVYKTANPALDKERVLKAVNFYKNSDKLAVPRNGVLSDSLFFQYIALIMQKVSEELRTKYGKP